MFAYVTKCSFPSNGIIRPSSHHHIRSTDTAATHRHNDDDENDESNAKRRSANDRRDLCLREAVDGLPAEERRAQHAVASEEHPARDDARRDDKRVVVLGDGGGELDATPKAREKGEAKGREE